MAYAPSIVTTTQYFDKRKALANGIAVAGGGIGNFLAPPLMQLLLDWYHLRGSFLILAGLMLHICLSGALFRPIVYPNRTQHAKLVTSESQTAHNPHSVALSKSNPDTCETLCHMDDRADSVQLLPKPPDHEETNVASKSDSVRDPVENNRKQPMQTRTKGELYLDEGYGTSTEKSDVTVPSESQESPGATPTIHVTSSNGEVPRHGNQNNSTTCCSGASFGTMLQGCCWSSAPQSQRRPIFEWQLLKNTVFLIYGFSMFFAFSGYPNIFMIILSHAKQMNIDRNRATFLVSIVGIFDVVGRIGFGWFSDLNLIQKKHGFMITMAVAGLACLLMPVVGDSYIGLSILCAVFGLFAGSFYALLPAILVEGLGEKKLLSAFGLVTLFMGTAFIYATFVVGEYENQKLCYFVKTCVFVCACVCV